MKISYGSFNLRHLAKGLKYEVITPEDLGITANQVKVLKSWLKTTGLKDGKKLTPLRFIKIVKLYLNMFFTIVNLIKIS